MDPERIRQIEAELANPAELTTEHIEELRTELRTLLREIGSEAASVERNAAIRTIDEHLQALDAVADARAEETARLNAEAEEILSRALDSDDEPEGDEPETPAEEPAPADDAEVPEGEPAEAEQELEPVAASARPTLGEIAANRPARHAPSPAASPRGPRVTVATEGTSAALGSEVESWGQVVEMFQRKHDDIAGADSHSGEFARIVSIKDDRYDGRKLSPGNDPEANSAIIADAFGVANLNEFLGNIDAMRAITASGGLCAPVEGYYEQAHVGDPGRPVAGSLPGFGATRGGIRIVPPVKITDITADQASAAITTITMAQDTASKAKTKQTITCPAVTETDVTALALRLGFGNVLARTFPERVANILQVAQDQFSRVKERRLLTQIGAGSTVVSTAQVYGATRDIYGAITRAAAGYRNRHRMNPEAPLRVILPAWALDLMQVDISNMKGATLDHFETTDEQVQSFFSRIAVNITWARDGEIAKGLGVAQDYAAQSGLSSALLDFPDNMVWYMFHEGAWLYLNGGSLDLGLVRDSTLNSTNDYEVMEESFEDVAFVGVESLKVITPVCSNGAAPADVTAGVCAAKVGFGS